MPINPISSPASAASARPQGGYVSGTTINERTPDPVQAFNVPPPCPRNVPERDWNELLGDLPEKLTLETWCEAVMCGFSKTPIGQSTSWVWHNILLDKFGLSNLPYPDHLELFQLLEVLWTESSPNPSYVNAQDVKGNPEILNSLDQSNELVEFIGQKFRVCETEMWSDAWSFTKRSFNLTDRLVEELPLLADYRKITCRPSDTGRQIDPLEEKICRFLDLLDKRDGDAERRVCITEPVFQQIKAHWSNHMNEMNHPDPNTVAEDTIKTWNEIDAACSINLNSPCDDLLSRFRAFADMADYG